MRYIGIVFLLIFLLTCGTKQTNEQRVNTAINNLNTDAPELMQAINRLGFPQPMLVIGDLPGETLGQTSIYHDGSATIVIDVNKVLRKRDRLEPVIGHEYYHVLDARTKYGIDRFIDIANRDKNLPYFSKEVEISAIKQEDALRVRLLSTGKYNGMASSRTIQNNRDF